MQILDSNIWIAFLNKNDSQHKKAENIFSRLNAKILLPEYIVLEVCSVLNQKVSKKTADLFLKIAFLNKDVKILPSEDFVETVSLFIERKDGKLSFVDVLLLYLSEKNEIISFDKDLKKAIKIAKI